jgi:hypothetical protein
MTTPRVFHWLVPGVLVGVIGCGGSAPPPEQDAAVPVIVASTEPADPKPTTQATQPAKPADPPPTLVGKAVAKALVVPPPLPADPPTDTKPKPYSSPLDRGETPLPPLALKPFNFTPTPTTSAVKPSPPWERQLPDNSTAAIPEGRRSERPLVKAPAPMNAGAADVPMNAWKQNDRAPLEDPTADLSAVRVIDTPLPVNVVTLPFLRMSIPNPFEFAEQLKGKLGKDAEVGVGPMK